jgi:hypothetical protein
MNLSICDLLAQADHAGVDTANPLGYSFLASPTTVLPRSEHYDSLGRGILALMGQVDPQLIDDAMAERASGQHTLH